MQTTDKSLPELRQEIRGAIARARLLVAQAEAYLASHDSPADVQVKPACEQGSKSIDAA